MLADTLTFGIGFGIFVLLVLVLAVFVIRFARQQGRRARQDRQDGGGKA